MRTNKNTFLKYFLIWESASDIVWHFSNNPLSILKTNKFSLGTEIGPDSTKSGYPFYISTARSKTGSYSENPRGIIFKLNGRLLNANYKSKPVDYWAGSGIKSRDLGSHEMEDRIYSKNPIIPNATKYILEIQCWIDEKYGYNSVYTHYIKRVEDLANKLDIPIVVYSSYDHFIMNKNPKKSITEIVDLSKIEQSPSYKFKNHTRKKNIRYILSFLAQLKDPDEIYGRYDSEIILSNAYTNYLRRKHDKSSIYAKQIISNILRKLKLTSVEELMKMRIKQNIRIKEIKNNLYNIEHTLKTQINSIKSGQDYDFDRLYDFNKFYLGGSNQTLNKIFKSFKEKDIDSIVEIFNTAKQKFLNEIEEIESTFVDIPIMPPSKKREDTSWKEIQI